MQLKTLMFGLGLFSLAGTISAQSSASVENSTTELNTISLPSLTGDEWTFYLDAENKVYYIDFETISVNLNDVQVKTEEGKVVLEDDLYDLPVNTIYELDFTGLDPGKYEIQLRTYTGIIKKEVTISE